MTHPGFGEPFCLGQALVALQAFRPDGLVGRAAWSALARTGHGLPPIWQWGMVECRLAGRHSFDLLACVAGEPDERGQYVQGADRHVPVAVARWATASSLRDVPQLWLEWDGGRTDREPLAWFGIDPGFYDPSRAVSLPDQASLALDALAVPGAEGVGLARSLTRIAAMLEGRGTMLGIGPLSPRGRRGWRVFLQVTRTDIDSLLDELEWPGDRAEARRWCGHALPPLEPGFLQLELDPGVRPYLGIEARQTARGFSNRPFRERWLAALVAQGLATPRAAQGMLAWNGESPAGAGEAWLRTFHIKVALAPPSPPKSKGYLGFGRVVTA